MRIRSFDLAIQALIISVLLQLVHPATAQDAAAPKDPAPALPMNAAEKQFQESMSNVTMTGFFTVGDDPQTHEDKYTIEKITKIGDDLWNFEARVGYSNREFKAIVKVPVKWAGETPVFTLSNYLIKDHGVFSARILIHNGMYAGTWGAQDHGGKMFGKIVKIRTPK
jgi:hypothetical protein